MSHPFAVIRQSPLIFVLRVAVAEFVFSLLLITVAASAIVQMYEMTEAARVVSFPLLLALVITFLQVIIVFVAFLSWYYPIYRLTPSAILLRSGPLAQERTLVDAAEIGHVEVKQNWLGRRLGYGALLVEGCNGQLLAKLRNVHDPQALAEQVRGMMQEKTELPAALESPLPTLIAAGEGEFVEFKASLMWDYRKQAVNKELYEPVMKNLVAFMNARGGLLLIGVDDDGEIVGIEPDLQTLRKPGVDGFENTFNMAFGKMVGMEYRPFITVSFPVLDDKTLCAIRVRPATHPAYLHHQGKEEFYLRTGNSSNALGVSAAVQYIQSRFA